MHDKYNQAFDFKYSGCSDCEFAGDCQYYYNNCPNGLRPAEVEL